MPCPAARCSSATNSGILSDHGGTLANTYRPVYQFVFDNELGEVLFAPVDVVVQQDPLRVRQPDLFFMAREGATLMTT